MKTPDLAAELARAVFAEGDQLAERHFPSAGPCRRLAFVHGGDKERRETYNGGLCESALADRLRMALKFREILTARQP
mgnify:CR=1